MIAPEEMSIKEKVSKQKIKKLPIPKQTNEECKLDLSTYTTKELTDEIEKRNREEKQNYVDKIHDLASNNVFVDIVAPGHRKTNYMQCSDRNLVSYSSGCLRCCLLTKTFDPDMILKVEMKER